MIEALHRISEVIMCFLSSVCLGLPAVWVSGELKPSAGEVELL